MLKKFLLAAGIALAVLVPTTIVDASEHKVKVTICHWANGHPHAISVSVNAVEGVDTGHGLLTDIDLDADTAVLTPHDTPGHAEDSFMHFGKEFKDSKVDLDDDDLTNDTSDDDACADSAPPPPPGPPGEDGKDGVDGKDGEDGTDGATGPAGPAGSAGATGAAGSTGSVGLTGPQGLAGAEIVTTTTTAPPASATELPRTGLADWLWMLGAAMVAAGVCLTLWMRTANKA